jgi:hypothetical protein
MLNNSHNTVRTFVLVFIGFVFVLIVSWFVFLGVVVYNVSDQVESQGLKSIIENLWCGDGKQCIEINGKGM